MSEGAGNGAVTLERERSEERTETKFKWQEAAIWLREYLSQQPGKRAEGNQLRAAAREAGFALNTLTRARQALQLPLQRTGIRENVVVWYYLEPPPNTDIKHPRPVLPPPGRERYLRSGLFLLEYLGSRPDGWAWVQEVKTAGIAAGYSPSTLSKARAELGILFGRGHRAKYWGGSRGWWQLPDMDIEAVREDWKERLRLAAVPHVPNNRSKYIPTEHVGIERTTNRWSVRYKTDGKQRRKNFPLDQHAEAIAFRTEQRELESARFEMPRPSSAVGEIMVLERLRALIDAEIARTGSPAFHLVLSRALISQALLGWKTVRDKEAQAA